MRRLAAGRCGTSRGTGWYPEAPLVWQAAQRQTARLGGPRGAWGHTARAASVWGHRVLRTCPPDSHQPGPSAGPWALAEEVEHEPGMRKGPGWFVNRSLKITP
jgi:hypothetical protein